MENQSNQDCECSDGCCTTQKKRSIWSKILFLVIVLAAGTIITVKLVAKQNEPPANCCDTAEKPACCSQPKQNTPPPTCCNTTATPACCSQSGK